MAKVNTPRKAKPKPNLAGGASYEMPDRERLVSMVLGAYFGEPAYYGDQTLEMIILANKVCKKHPEFLAKLAVFARETMFLRTTPTVLIGILGLHGKNYVRDAMRRVILRPDQVTELMAWCNLQKTPNIHQVKIGVADAFNRFDAYQIGKYKGGPGITLRDALVWCHAKPKDDKQSRLFKSLIDGNVPIPDTWETRLSKYGNIARVWEELLDSGKLPYMAALRNLRNMVKARLSAEYVVRLCRLISDPTRVATSKQYPYRFYSAQEQLCSCGLAVPDEILEAVAQAAEYSVANVPQLAGATFCTADNSGSMDYGISEKSKMTRKMVANLMQAILKAKNRSTLTSVFAEDFKVVGVRASAGVLDNTERFSAIDVGCSTYAYKPVDYLLRDDIVVNRMIILTDMQLWDNEGGSRFRTAWLQYCNYIRGLTGAAPWLHIINLAGYGQAVMPAGQSHVSLVSGWTDRIFDFIPMVERGVGAMVEEIEKIEWKEAPIES